MTHSPPVPPANQAPYPPVEPPHAPKAAKTIAPAPKKAKRVPPPATGSVLPVALIVGAAVAAVAGFAIWSARDASGDRG